MTRLILPRKKPYSVSLNPYGFWYVILMNKMLTTIRQDKRKKPLIYPLDIPDGKRITGLDREEEIYF